jgi:hypothetical protein
MHIDFLGHLAARRRLPVHNRPAAIEYRIRLSSRRQQHFGILNGSQAIGLTREVTLAKIGRRDVSDFTKAGFPRTR